MLNLKEIKNYGFELRDSEGNSIEKVTGFDSSENARKSGLHKAASVAGAHQCVVFRCEQSVLQTVEVVRAKRFGKGDDAIKALARDILAAADLDREALSDMEETMNSLRRSIPKVTGRVENMSDIDIFMERVDAMRIACEQAAFISWAIHGLYPLLRSELPSGHAGTLTKEEADSLIDHLEASSTLQTYGGICLLNRLTDAIKKVSEQTP